MSENERRNNDRHEYVAPTAMMLAAGSLEGETVNASEHGLLIRATGNISVVDRKSVV